MRFLAELHGTIAGVVICALLFIDEAGVPLPIAPSEVLLIVAGVLIRTGALPAAIFCPAAAGAMIGGMMTGYTWARTAGENGLQELARRVNAEAVYSRALRRLRTARPVELGIVRLLPGVRPWATLVSGAAAMELPRFLLGALPALLIWESVWVVAGIVVGFPAEHLLGRFEKLLLRGVILLVLGVGGYLAARHFRKEGVLQYRGVGLAFALLLAGALIASTVAGILAISRGLTHFREEAWIDAVAVLVVLIVAAGVSLLRFELTEVRNAHGRDHT